MSFKPGRCSRYQVLSQGIVYKKEAMPPAMEDFFLSSFFLLKPKKLHKQIFKQKCFLIALQSDFTNAFDFYKQTYCSEPSTNHTLYKI